MIRHWHIAVVKLLAGAGTQPSSFFLFYFLSSLCCIRQEEESYPLPEVSDRLFIPVGSGSPLPSFWVWVLLVGAASQEVTIGGRGRPWGEKRDTCEDSFPSFPSLLLTSFLFAVKNGEFPAGVMRESIK